VTPIASEPRQTRRLLLVLGLVALAACGLGLALLAAGHSASSEPQPRLWAKGLFPRFDTRVHRYVIRCPHGKATIRVAAPEGTGVAVGGASERSGRFAAEVRARPGQDFEIAAGPAGATEPYSVRCLPAGFPAWRFEPRRPLPAGLFVVSFPGTPKTGPSWVVVFDNHGAPRWWFKPPTSALGAQVLSDGSVTWSRSFGDGYGIDPRMAHEIRSLSGRLLRTVRTAGAVTDSHELLELPNGDFLIDAYKPRPGADLRAEGGPRGVYAISAEIQEVNREGDVVWRWSSAGRIGPEETPARWWDNVLSNPKPGPGGVPVYDPVHVNSVETWGPDRLVVSTRHTDAVFGIDRSSGRIVWKLGGTPTPRSLRVIGDPAGKLTFGGQHDARIGEGGVLSVFDNGKDRPRSPRAVRYRLDLDERTATFLDQLTDPEVTYSHCCGSARPIDGGWLVDWGRNPLTTAFDDEGRIAFRIHFPISTYRAVPVPDAAVTLGDLERGLEAME
jgi:hypothetical protein